MPDDKIILSRKRARILRASLTKQITSSALWICFSALFCATASAANISSYVSNEGKEIIILKGDIGTGDAEHLAALINKANEAGRLVSGIRLNSPGGQISEGVKLADIVKTAKIATVVARGTQCASACFIVFAAGNEKYASYQARVGVHGASDQNGQETQASNSATVAMARIVKELGVPPAIIGRMVVTPPTEIVWLTSDELASMGTKMTGRPAQLSQGSDYTSPVIEPRQLGISKSLGEDQKPTWKLFIDRAIDMSSSQNGGKPNILRGCQPEFKICNMAVFYKDNKGKDTMAKIVEDTNGNIIRKEVCVFNDFGDIRTCVEWDSGRSHKDMKDNKGNWSEVSN